MPFADRPRTHHERLRPSARFAERDDRRVGECSALVRIAEREVGPDQEPDIGI